MGWNKYRTWSAVAVLSLGFLLPRPEIPPTAALAAVALLLAAGVLVLAMIAVRRGTFDPERVACGVVGLLLVFTVLVNPITSPQYVLIAGGGLFLLTVGFGLSLWVAAFVPFVGLLTYFVDESPWVFFYDLWGQRLVHLPQLPVSSRAEPPWKLWRLWPALNPGRSTPPYSSHGHSPWEPLRRWRGSWQSNFVGARRFLGIRVGRNGSGRSLEQAWWGARCLLPWVQYQRSGQQ